MNRSIRKSAFASGILSAAVCANSAFAEQSIFRDDFYVAPASQYVNPCADTGWAGFTANPPFDPGATTSILGEASMNYWVNNGTVSGPPTNPDYLSPASNPGETGTHPGAIYWLTWVPDSLAIFTQKASVASANIQTSTIRSISFDVNTNTPANEQWNLSALVNVGGNWFASTTGVNNNSATSNQGYASVAIKNSGTGFNNYTIDARTSRWFRISLDNNPITLGGDPFAWTINQITHNGPGITLPTGQILGLGLCTLPNPAGNGYIVPQPTSTALLITDYNVTASASKITWNNAGGTGDGVHWDMTQANFNTGSGATAYDDGSSVTFNDANNGNYAVTLNSTVNPTSVIFNNQAGNYVVSGTGSIAGSTSVIINSAGPSSQATGQTVTLSTFNSYTGGTFVNSGTLIVGGDNGIPDSSALTIGTSTNAATVQLATPEDSVTTLSSLTLNTGSTLDLNSNTLAVNYAPGHSNYSAILSSVNASCDGGLWDKPGITSSVVKATIGGARIYTLAVIDGSDPNNTAGIPSNTIEVVPALVGDIRLTGAVDFGDYQIFLANYGTGTTWETGNFHYSGTTSFGDYQQLLQNFGAVSSLTASQLASIEAFGAQLGAVVTPNADGFGFTVTVPEPSSMTLLLCGAFVRATRRRRP